MLSVQFTGGLGNILFQLFSTISIATKNCVPCEFAANKYVGKMFYPSSLFTQNPDNSHTILREHNLETLADCLSTHESVIISGTLQDHTHFNDLAPVISNLTGITRARKDAQTKFACIFSSANTTPTVSLHIRRGDYVANSCYHLVLSSYYYRNAILNICGRLPSARIICFYEPGTRGDAEIIIADLIKTLESIGRASQFEFLHFHDLVASSRLEAEDYEEMLAMSMCDHNIIANSTFSWWGAYLAGIYSDRNERIVCYPNEFYNHQLYYLNINGLCVDGWTKIMAWDDANEYRCRCFKLMEQGMTLEEIWKMK